MMWVSLRLTLLSFLVLSSLLVSGPGGLALLFFFVLFFYLHNSLLAWNVSDLHSSSSPILCDWHGCLGKTKASWASSLSPHPQPLTLQPFFCTHTHAHRDWSVFTIPSCCLSTATEALLTFQSKLCSLVIVPYENNGNHS